MVTVPKRTFSVLPSLAPEDGSDTDEERVLREELGEEGGRDVRSDLQRMLLWSVVSDEREGGEGRDGRGDEVSFRGVQVTAAGVDAERPGGGAGGFPGGESEGVEEEVRDCGERDGFRRRKRGGVEERRVENRVVAGGVLEREERRREVSAERVWLIGPVETSRASCVTSEGVFCLVVVLENLSELLFLFLFFVFLLKGRAFQRP